jgi:hypothetical protein
MSLAPLVLRRRNRQPRGAHRVQRHGDADGTGPLSCDGITIGSALNVHFGTGRAAEVMRIGV